MLIGCKWEVIQEIVPRWVWQELEENDLLEGTFCRSRGSHSNEENSVFYGPQNDYSGNSNRGNNRGTFNWFKIDAARDLSPLRARIMFAAP